MVITSAQLIIDGIETCVGKMENAKWIVIAQVVREARRRIADIIQKFKQHRPPSTLVSSTDRTDDYTITRSYEDMNWRLEETTRPTAIKMLLSSSTIPTSDTRLLMEDQCVCGVLKGEF